MIESSIEAVIFPLWPQARDVADLAGKDRAGLIVKPGHHMQNRGRLLQRLLRSGHAADQANQRIAPVLQIGVDDGAAGCGRQVSGVAARGAPAKEDCAPR